MQVVCPEKKGGLPYCTVNLRCASVQYGTVRKTREEGTLRVRVPWCAAPPLYGRGLKVCVESCDM